MVLSVAKLRLSQVAILKFLRYLPILGSLTLFISSLDLRIFMSIERAPAAVRGSPRFCNSRIFFLRTIKDHIAQILEIRGARIWSSTIQTNWPSERRFSNRKIKGISIYAIMGNEHMFFICPFFLKKIDDKVCHLRIFL